METIYLCHSMFLQMLTLVQDKSVYLPSVGVGIGRAEG